ncbi:protein YgfX [Rheinheimera salexigens]
MQSSTLAQCLLWLVLPSPLLVLMANPVPTSGWLIIIPLLLGYYLTWLALIQRRQNKQLATITADGQLHWFAPINDTGQVKVGGLVSQYVLRLDWYSDNQQRLLQQWIFFDQCQPTDFRAIARVISQTNWSVTKHNKLSE